MTDLKKTSAWIFFKQSCLSYDKIFQGKFYRIDPVALYKVYKNAIKTSLPEPYSKTKDLYDILRKRRSIRDYKKDVPLSLKELSTILWASQGVTGEISGYSLRTAPSAGALYPIETYLVIRYVEGIPSGLYHFNVKEFLLELIEEGNFSHKITKASLNQFFMGEACVVLCWSAVFRRSMSKYGERGMRYIFMDVGHICQNVLLVAEAMGLGACPVGAFLDEDMNRLFGLNKDEESIIYCVSIGIKE